MVYNNLFKANEDILCIMLNVKNIGWFSLKEQSLQRIIYLSQVLYYFTHEDKDNLFDYYHFSLSLYGPFSSLVNNSVVFLKSNQYLMSDKTGNLILNKESPKSIDESKKKWLKEIIYILGIYGEDKIFGFTINDPLYKEAFDTNQTRELNASSPNNKTIEVLNEFKAAFENTLENINSISKEEYLELYFEYIFSQIIKS